MDDLVETYIKIREKKAQLKAEYDGKLRKYDDALDKIESLMLVRFGDLGVDSVKTPHGTAYAAVRSSVTIADWDSYYEFLKANDAWEFLERRASKPAVEHYRSEHNDLPPGLNWVETKVINFRRS